MKIIKITRYTILVIILSINFSAAQTWTNIMTEDFEGTFPNGLWQVYAATQNGYANCYWGAIDIGNNNKAAWCAAAGQDAPVITANFHYINNMDTWMVYGPFDLSDASDAVLEFDYYNNSEPGYDIFFVGIAKSLQDTLYGYYEQDSTGIFQHVSYDLKNFSNLGNLTGKSGWYLEFLFYSDSSVSSNYEGAFVDNVVLKKVKIQIPAQITLSNTFSFGGLTQNSYRMIGLPGNQTTEISSLITAGTQKTDWDVFDDDGSTTDFLKEYDGSFAFSPGKGYWVLSKNSFTVNATVDNVALSSDNTYSIPLHTGFNIISNPFIKSVSWTDIQNLNGLTSNQILSDWTGSGWQNAAQMLPYKAYYFKNSDGLSALKIPYNFTAAKVATEKPAEIKTYPGDFIKLSLLLDKQIRSYTVAGFSSSAKEDYDVLDYFAPPGYFDEIRINIEDQNISDPYKQLFVDYRPGINKGQTFDLKIKNTTKQTVNLVADGTDKFANYEVYLLDKNLNQFYNLKEQSEIELSPVHKNYNYQLLIGIESYINNIKKGNVPTEYAIYQNYPNPFNPVTLIRYQIPNKNIFVELKVFNILGKEIKTLVNEIQDPGIHEVEFNASDLSSGVYFYTLKAGSYSATRKMILLK
ncbi:MAG: T9SS type A sorting domain-containing protein [Ignavibacteriaceae bacterium]